MKLICLLASLAAIVGCKKQYESNHSTKTAKGQQSIAIGTQHVAHGITPCPPCGIPIDPIERSQK